MEIDEVENINQIKSHIDELKKICENLKVNIDLLEIPIHNMPLDRLQILKVPERLHKNYKF